MRLSPRLIFPGMICRNFANLIFDQVMKTTELATRSTRIAQLSLSAVAAVTLFLPWATYFERMMSDSRITNVSGYQTLFGRCLATFLVCSLIVSALENLFNRRAAFVHVGFFVASLLIAVLAHLLPMIPGLNVVEIKFGLHLYVIFATLVFAVTGMLSPRNER